MKKNYKMTVKTALAVLCCVGLQQFASAQTTETINVSEDTYVQGTTSASDSNYGTEPEGRARDTSTSAPRFTYYKFPVGSNLPSSVTSAKLKVYIYAPITDPTKDPNEVMQIHKVSSDWSEEVVTYNSKPTTGAFITEFDVATVATPIVSDNYTEKIIDVTAYFNQVLAAQASNISFAVKAKVKDDGGGGINVRTGTRENEDQAVGASIEINYVLGVDDLETNQSVLKVYPNPTKSTFSLNKNFKSPDVLEVSIFNVLGSRVAAFKESVNQGVWNKEYRAEALNMTKGIYLLQVSSKNGKSVSKLIVE